MTSAIQTGSLPEPDQAERAGVAIYPSSSPQASEMIPEANVSTERKASILLVDDQGANLVALQAVLGGMNQNLVTARSGEEALRRLLQEDFALILLDIQMPGLDGIETAALIRGRDKCRHIPIIFFTAHADADLQVLRGYSLGAVDYLVKPIVPDILRAKVQVFVDLFHKTEKITRQASLLLDHSRKEHEREMHEALAKIEEERRRAELRLARQVQQRLFPSGPFPFVGFEVGGASYPAADTGGDYFDFIPMLDGQVGIVIGDVCGHGLAAALLMAETRALLWGLSQAHTDVGTMLGAVNRMLYKDTGGEMFVTLLLIRLDPKSRTFSYASAGHPPGYVLDRSGEVRERLESTGPALGIMAQGEFEVRESLQLEPGEILFLLTDGIEEACDPSDVPFGNQRPLDVIRSCRELSPDRMISKLYDAVRAYSGDVPQVDDITAVVMKVSS